MGDADLLMVRAFRVRSKEKKKKAKRMKLHWTAPRWTLVLEVVL